MTSRLLALLVAGGLAATPLVAQERGRGAHDASAAVRLPDGRPGPGYWQQYVRYDVDARLEPGVRRLTGRARIGYHNASPDTLRELYWHLYQNIFRADAGEISMVGRDNLARTRGIAVRSIEVNGRAVATEVTRTLMRTALPTLLAPGDSLAVRVTWDYEVPAHPTLRTGSRGTDFGMAQWYPQIATYDDRFGWDTTAHVGKGEFYLEYGDWDVRLTVPGTYLVAATGTLQNAGTTLSAEQGRRLASVAAGRVTHVVPPGEIGARTRDAPAERTWRFTAEGVRDFAWAASPDYVWDATRTVPNAARPDGVLVHSFYRADELRDYRESAALAREAIEYWSARLGAYVYPQASVVSGPVEGMEYPMLAFGGPASRIENMPDAVIIHELGHQWYPMMLGTHETRYPAMDEGMTTFISTLFMAHRFGPDAMWSPRMPLALRGVLGRGHERRIMQWLYTSDVAPSRGNSRGRDRGDISMLAHANGMTDLQIGLLVYAKTSSVLFMLRDVLGADTFDRAMRAYYDRWRLKHPQPTDFFNTVEDVAGRDLDWFWDQWFVRTAVLDLAVRAVVQREAGGRWHARVMMANIESAEMPATVRLALDDGSTRDVRVPETVWQRARSYTLDVPDLARRVRSVEIDPAFVLADVRRADNVWPRGTRPAMGPVFGMSARRIWALLALAWVVALLARLAGHWLGARRARACLLRLGLGPLTLWTAHRGTRLGWVGRPRPFGGGAVSVVEHGLDASDLRRRTAIALAGGPLATLALVPLALSALLLLEGANAAGLRPGSGYHLDTFIALLGAFGTIGFVLSLLPSRSRGFIPTRPWVRLLVFASPRSERLAAVRALYASSWVGDRPAAWDALLVAEATRLHDRSRAEAGACMLAYYHALDRGDVPAAVQWLTRAREAGDRWWRRGVRGNVLAECAFFAAYHEGDAGAAREHLRRARRRLVERRTLRRALAALALVEGNRARAASMAAGGIRELEAIRSSVGPGIAALEERWLRDILDRCEQDASPPDGAQDVTAPVADTVENSHSVVLPS